ncbi:MAG: Cof-type HAD-IIB family hydrolase, partial [Treponema sp.]|nr:Cof-type HAD-IIB family hydrolase [Treponema sp.]
GTLLNDRGKISAADLRSIKKLKEKGIPVFLMTGRHHGFAREICASVGFDYPICSSNGGHIYNYSTGETLFVKTIEDGINKRIYEYLCRERCNFIIYTREKIIFSSEQGDYSYWKRQNEISAEENRFTPRFITESGFDITKEKVVKYFILCESGKGKSPKKKPSAKELQEKLNGLFCGEAGGGDIRVSRSASNAVDINAAGVDKGAALKVLAEHYGFNIEGTLAMGDNENDAALLKAAGVPVAPAKAESEIKALAAYVTASCNDSPLTQVLKALYADTLE